MSANYSQITMLGNVTRDPDIRIIGSGAKVAKFAVAVNYKKDTPPSYFDVVAWDKNAENVEKMVKRGSSIFVTGRPTIREYEAKDGTKRRAFEVVMGAMQMTGGGGAGAADANGASASSNGANDSHEDTGFPSEMDTGVPF